MVNAERENRGGSLRRSLSQGASGPLLFYLLPCNKRKTKQTSNGLHSISQFFKGPSWLANSLLK